MVPVTKILKCEYLKCVCVCVSNLVCVCERAVANFMAFPPHIYSAFVSALRERERECVRERERVCVRERERERRDGLFAIKNN